MAHTKAIFNFYNSKTEQNLYEDLIIESINIYGIDMYHIPRVINNDDKIMGEDTVSTYENWYQMPFYIKNVEGFSGQGDFLSKFNIEIRDQITFNVARKVFNDTVPNQPRPFEGDLLYFPDNQKLFVIRFVEHEEIFYTFGKLQMWTMNAEVFEYSGERLITGIPEIDSLGGALSDNMANYAILDTDGFVITDTDGFAITDPFDLADPVPLEQNDAFEDQKTIVVSFDESNPFAELI